MAENKLSYVNYNFSDLVTELTNRLRVKDTWKDAYISGTGQTLIELYAYLGNMLLYNLERSFEECFIATAKKKSSIVNLVQLIGYKPKRKTSATGSVTFTADKTPLEVIGIPKYTVVTTSDGIEYVTQAETALSGTTQVVEIIQGKLQTVTFTSDGSQNQEFAIDSTSVENNVNVSMFKVYSKKDGVIVEWKEVDSFLYSTPTSIHYVIRTNYDETVTVIFGNDVNGKIPTNGDLVYIQYLESDGVSGNLYEIGAIDTVQNPTIEYEYYDTSGNAVGTDEITLTVSNHTVVIGGDDAEDIEEIRVEAPKVFKTGDRLVTREDYESFIINYPDVADVNVWGENEETNPDYDYLNRVNICAITKQWQDFDITDTKMVAYLKEKSMLTVLNNQVSHSQLLIYPFIDIYVNKGYGLDKTKSKVQNVCLSNFNLGVTLFLGESKRVSNLVQAIEELTEIAYIHLILEVKKALDYDSGVGYTGTLTSTTIKPGSIRVMDGTTQIGVDIDGGSNDGTFEAFGDYSGTITGTIDYDTGSIQIDAYPLDSDELFVYYQQDNDGDIIVTNNQICRFMDMNVNTLAYKV